MRRQRSAPHPGQRPPIAFSPLGRRACACALACAAGLLPACSSDGPPAAPGPTPAAAPVAVSLPIDFREVARAARLAYRPDGDGWLGRADGYEVRARAAGFEVTPVRRAGSRAGEAARGAPLSIATARIARGDRVLADGRSPAQGGGAAPPTSPGPARVEADGHLAVDRGAATEHLRNRDGGVELSYTFPARPDGAGDLTVRLDVSGERYAGLARGGHRFADPAKGLGLHFGEATWIDAHGARAPVDVRAVPGGLELRVPGDVVERSAFPAVLDPIISPEITLDDPPFTVAPSFEGHPALAFDGTSYLAVWTDRRSGNYDIRGARIAEDGTVLDPGSFLITSGASDEGLPRVAFDGTNFLVVWADPATDALASINADVRGARVTPQGAVLDPNGFDISAAAGAQGWPAVAFDRTNYLVAWADLRATPQASVYAARVSPSGDVLDPAGIPVAAGPTHLAEPGIAFDGASSLITWRDKRNDDGDLYGARVTPQGVVLDPAGLPLAVGVGTQQTPKVAFDGANHVVAFRDDVIRAIRVTPQGNVLDSGGLPLSPPSVFAYDPNVAFDGTNAVVLWSEESSPQSLQLFGARVSPAGAVLDSGGVPLTPNHLEVNQPAIAHGSASTLAVWTQRGPGLPDIYGSRLSAQLAALDAPGFPVAGARATEEQPAVAFDGQNYVVAWADSRTPTSALYAVRVTPSGAVLDPAGILIADGPAHEWKVKAVFNGTNTVLVWQTHDNFDDSDWFAARLDPQGVVLDPVPISIPLGYSIEESFQVASDGAGNVIVIGDDGGLGNDFNIRVVLLGPSGTVLPPGRFQLPMPGYQYGFSVSFNGTNYLVTWSDDRNGGSDLYGARVTRQGALLDPVGFPISELAAGGFTLSLGVSGLLGSNSLVAWAEERGGVKTLFAAEVSDHGVVLSPHSIPVAPLTIGYLTQPGITFDGTRALLLWRDGQSGSEADIFGTQILPGGAVQPMFTVANEPGNESWPYVASDGSGHALVVYNRKDDGIPRAHARLITEAGGGGAGGAGGGQGAGGSGAGGSGAGGSGAGGSGAGGSGAGGSGAGGSGAGGSGAGGSGAGGSGAGAGGSGAGAGGSGAGAGGSGAGAGGNASNGSAGGASGEGGDERPTLDATDNCSCRAVGAPPGGTPVALLALGAALAARRRQGRGAPRPS